MVFSILKMNCTLFSCLVFLWWTQISVWFSWTPCGQSSAMYLNLFAWMSILNAAKCTKHLSNYKQFNTWKRLFCLIASHCEQTCHQSIVQNKPPQPLKCCCKSFLKGSHSVLLKPSPAYDARTNKWLKIYRHRLCIDSWVKYITPVQ